MDNSTGQHGSWVEDYVASYEYGGKWFALIFPIFGMLGIYLARHSEAAIAVAIGAEVLFILAFFEWKTYYVRIGAGSITRGSCLHSKTFPLSDVDLIQHVYGGGRGGGQFLYIRHGNKILCTVYQDLVGFDDLLGFLREYARHRHIIFATRDDWGEWTQG
jgi:hypothetical protein